jgi:hypothetical protein
MHWTTRRRKEAPVDEEKKMKINLTRIEIKSAKAEVGKLK